MVSLNKLWQWHNMAINKRWDICNVGLSNIAKLCAFILFVFSFCVTECRCIIIHDSSVLFAVGSWLMRLWSSRSWGPTWGNEAASSNRVVRSVVKIGSGSSLRRKTNQTNVVCHFVIPCSLTSGFFFTWKIILWVHNRLEHQNLRCKQSLCCCKWFSNVELLSWLHQLCKFDH